MGQNQHYIPRSYLKNFGYLVNTYQRPSGKVDEKWSIHNIENGGEIKVNSTKKICSEEELYDLPLFDEESRGMIEKTYDKEVDKYFSEVTGFISDENNTTLTSEIREKILRCSLSLYFRTPKHVGISPSEIKVLEAKIPDINERSQELNKLKHQKVLDHYSKFEQLVKQKNNIPICVNKAVGDWDFISGDNPVIARNTSGEVKDIFSKENIFHIPMTPNFCVTLIPETEQKQGTFTRFEYPNHHIITINHDIEKFHEKYIFGSEKALKDYLEESPAYKLPADESHPFILEMKSFMEALNHCLSILKMYGLASYEYKIAFTSYWTKNRTFREDPNNIKMARLLGIIE